MEPSELLQRIVTILEWLGLRYFVTGSMATEGARKAGASRARGHSSG